MLCSVIEREEWATVARFASTVGALEVDRARGGVRLQVVAGQRTWLVAGPWSSVRIEGGQPVVPAGGRPGRVTVWLPTRLVVRAAGLATVDGWCELRVRDGVAQVSSPSGSAQFDVAGWVPEVEALRPLPAAASAVVDGDGLVELLRVAWQVPDGVDLAPHDGPLFWLAVAEGRLEVAVDWTAYGACSSSFSLPALTTGAARVTVVPTQLSSIVEGIVPGEDLEVRVAPGGPVTVAGAGWVASLTLVDAWVRSAHGALDDALEALPWPVATSDEGRRLVMVGDTVVALGVVEGSPPRVLLRVELADGLAATPELLGELNELTAGLVGVRVWWHDGVVLAETDVRVDRLGDLGTALRDLVAGVEDLGLLLLALPTSD